MIEVIPVVHRPSNASRSYTTRRAMMDSFTFGKPPTWQCICLSAAVVPALVAALHDTDPSATGWWLKHSPRETFR